MSEDFLEHFGVKGMRWGVRKDRGGGGGKAPSARKQRNQAIKEARGRQRKREIGVYKSVAKLPFADDWRKSGRKLVDDVGELYIGKDAKMARKMTTGEKAATGALFTLGAVAFAVLDS